MPADRINIASTVTVAELENPESPSETLGNDSGSICPKIMRTIRIRNAVISTGRRSVTNRKSAPPMTRRTRKISIVMKSGRERDGQFFYKTLHHVPELFLVFASMTKKGQERNIN